MNVRLSDTDQTHIRIVQAYFGNLDPVSVELSNTDVVRLSLRKLVEKLAASNEQVAEQVAALGRGNDSGAETPAEGPGALTGVDRKRRYNGFFRGLISQLHERGFDKQRKAPSTSWYNFSAGHGMSSKVQYASSFNRDAKARVELYLDSDQESNKALFDHLYREREAIQAEFGEALDWQRLSNKKASRIAVFPRDASIEDDDATLADIQAWMAEKLRNLDRVLGPRLESLISPTTRGAR
jgi:hypothetical protein